MIKKCLIVCLLLLVVSLEGCLFPYYYPPQPQQRDCSSEHFDKHRIRFDQTRTIQKELCEQEDYLYSEHWTWFHRCDGSSNYTFRCVKIDNNILVGEYIFDSANGQLMLVKLKVEGLE